MSLFENIRKTVDEHRSKIKSLESELIKAKNSTAGIIAEKRKIELEMSSLKKSSLKINEALENAKERIGRILDERHELNRKLERANEKLVERDKALAIKQKELDKLTKELADYQAVKTELDELKKRSSELNQKYLELSKERDNQVRTADLNYRQLSDTRQTIRELEVENATLKQQLKAPSVGLDEKDRLIQDLEKLVKQKTQDHDKALDELRITNGKLKAQIMLVDDFEQILDRVTNEKRALEDQHSKAQSEINRLSKVVDQPSHFVNIQILKKKEDEFRSEKLKLEQQIKDLKAENSKLELVNAQQDSIQAEVKSEKSDTEHKLTAAIVELDQLKAEHENLQSKFTDVTSFNTLSLNKVVSQKDKRYEQLSNENRILEERLASANSLIGKLDREINKQTKELRSHHQAYAELEKDKDRIQKLWELSEKEKEVLRNEIHGYESKIAHSRSESDSQLSEKDQELLGLKSSLVSKDKEIKLLSEKFEVLKGENSAIRQNLSKLERTKDQIIASSADFKEKVKAEKLDLEQKINQHKERAIKAEKDLEQQFLAQKSVVKDPELSPAVDTVAKERDYFKTEQEKVAKKLEHTKSEFQDKIDAQVQRAVEAENNLDRRKQTILDLRKELNESKETLAFKGELLDSVSRELKYFKDELNKVVETHDKSITELQAKLESENQRNLTLSDILRKKNLEIEKLKRQPTVKPNDPSPVDSFLVKERDHLKAEQTRLQKKMENRESELQTQIEQQASRAIKAEKELAAIQLVIDELRKQRATKDVNYLDKANKEIGHLKDSLSALGKKYDSAVADSKAQLEQEQQRSAALRKKLNQKDSEVEKLKKEVSKPTGEGLTGSFEKERRHFQAEQAKLEKKLGVTTSEFQAQIVVLTERATKAEKALAQKESEVKSAKKPDNSPDVNPPLVDRLIKERDYLQSELNKVIDKLNLTKKDFQDAEGLRMHELTKLRNSSDKKQAELKKLKAELSELTERRDHFEMEFKRVRGISLSLQSSLVDLKTKLKDAESKLALRDAEVDKLKAENEIQQSKVAERQKLMDELGVERADLASDLEAVRQENSALKVNLKTAENDLCRLKSIAGQATETYRKKLTEKDVALGEKSAELVKMREEMDMFEFKSKRLKECEADLENVKSLADSLNGRIDVLKLRETKQSNKIKELERANALQQTEIERNQGNREKIDALEKKISALNREISSLNLDREQNASVTQKQKAVILALEAEMKSLKGKMESQQAELGLLDHKRAKAEKEVVQLDEKLAEAANRAKAAEAELDKVRENTKAALDAKDQEIEKLKQTSQATASEIEEIEAFLRKE